MAISYRLIRSDRKSVAVEIKACGEVIVRAPKRMAQREIDRFVQSRADWIDKHLRRLATAPRPAMLTPEEIQALAKQALEAIPSRVARFAAQMGVTYGRITIRNQRTIWGSCSAKGNLNFNCLLMLMPSEVVDYVVVHELCHRKELNHSARFWAEVERVLPSYRAQKQWLKVHGAAIVGRLPAK